MTELRPQDVPRSGARRKLVWSVSVVVMIVLLAVLQLTVGVNPAQAIAVFVICGVPGGIYELGLAIRNRERAYRYGVVIALLGAFLLLWMNGAVGIIGSEEDPANLLFGGVFLVAFIGALIGRFRPRGMTLAMTAAAIAQLLVPLIALFVWPRTSDWGGAGMPGVMVFNMFFVFMFAGSAWMFRSAAEAAGSPRSGS